jgi:hypothetical protein
MGDAFIASRSLAQGHGLADSQLAAVAVRE